ncbi:MAG TPA: apolipoprotein N-acyltransferase [Ignavibacteriaceae bacterium]|nr:apolipoprotein N-acyltransferase [Ignavibacteriaceae bacterium]
MKLPFLKNRDVFTPEQKKQRKKERMLLVLSGVLLGISFPPFPFPFQLFMFVGLVPYLYVLEKRKTLAEINRATYLTFFVFSLITVYWVGSWQGGTDPFLMIAGGVLIFFNPLLFLIPSTLYYITKRLFNKNFALLAFPFFWITYEYFYMLTDISFPWLTLGSGLSKFTIFIQVADIIGAVGISVIVVYLNISLYRAIINYKNSQKSYSINMGAFVLIFAIVLFYGSYRLSTFQVSDINVRVGLIQPNINPWDKWKENNLDQNLSQYLDLTREAIAQKAGLILWPESALPAYLASMQYAKERDSIYNVIRPAEAYLMTGMPEIHYFTSNEKIPPDAKHSKQDDFYYSIYNGVLLFSPYSSQIERYGKIKLVPFGEHVPFSDQLPFLSNLFSWGVGISGWNVGRDTTVFSFKIRSKQDSVQIVYPLKINSLVCYESVYPYFVTNFVKKGADLITVVTNDSWYGRSSGPYQHKEIAVLRAIENRKTVIRDANGGISCIIDPLGKTLKETELFTRTVLVGDAPIQDGETFFTKHPLIIPTFASYLSICVFVFFLILNFRKKLKPIE